MESGNRLTGYFVPTLFVPVLVVCAGCQLPWQEVDRERPPRRFAVDAQQPPAEMIERLKHQAVRNAGEYNASTSALARGADLPRQSQTPPAAHIPRYAEPRVTPASFQHHSARPAVASPAAPVAQTGTRPAAISPVGGATLEEVRVKGITQRPSGPGVALLEIGRNTTLARQGETVNVPWQGEEQPFRIEQIYSSSVVLRNMVTQELVEAR